MDVVRYRFKFSKESYKNQLESREKNLLKEKKLERKKERQIEK